MHQRDKKEPLNTLMTSIKVDIRREDRAMLILTIKKELRTMAMTSKDRLPREVNVVPSRLNLILSMVKSRLIIKIMRFLHPSIREDPKRLELHSQLVKKVSNNKRQQYKSKHLHKRIITERSV